MKLKIILVLAGLFVVAAMLIPGGSSVNVRNIYEEAEKAFQEKRYQEAVDKYTMAIAEGKKWGADTKVIDEDFDSLAKYKIAVCYAELGKQLEDPSMYEKSLEIIPEIYEITKVAKVREGLIFLWGHSLYELERYEEAEPKFRELLNDYPDSQFAENAYYSLGNLYYELKQYEGSRDAFLQILKRFPNSAFLDDAQYFIARCFFDEGNYDQAHLEFFKVESVDNPDLVAQARYYDGLSLFRMGRNQDAITAYQKFVGDFPNSMFITPAYFDMGTIHSKLKEYDEATRNYQLAIQNAKDDLTKSEIQFYIGVNYLDQEDYQSAVTAYRALIDNYPSSVHIPEARVGIADSFWGLKDYGNAITAYTEVLDKDNDPERLAASTNRIGECYYQMGEKEQALEWYQKVIDTYPDSPTVKDATYGKIWSLNDLKRYEEADGVARDYINKYKTDQIYDIYAAETQMLLGDIKFDAENYLAAADDYLLVVSDYKDLPKFDSYKARSLFQAGYAYYREAEKSNWNLDLLKKSASTFEQLMDQYERNFDKDKREFQSRMDYIIPGIINLGQSYSRMNDYENARKAYDMMPKTSEEYGRAMIMKGESYVEEGKPNEAVVVYRQIEGDNSLSQTWRSRAAIEMADQLREAGRFAEAVAAYQNVVERYPESEYISTAMYYIGLSYYDMDPRTPENMSKAIEAFKKTLEKYPDSEVAPWSSLGIVMAYEATGTYDMVIKLAEEIENNYADSKIPDAKKVIDLARRQKVDAMSKLETGVSTDALIAEYRKVVNDPIGEDTGKISAQSRIGLLLFVEKRYDESIKEYEALLQKYPSGEHVASAYYQIAAAAYWTEDFNKSVDNASKGLMIPDTTPELKTGLYYYLGLSQSRLGNADGAIAAFKQAIQTGMSATDKEKTEDIVFASHRELARVYTSAKQYPEAVSEYQFLADNSNTDSDKAEAYFWTARVYEENMNDYENAAKNYETIRQLGVSDVLTAQSLYYLGVLYSTDLDEKEMALSTFQELTSKYSASEDANVQMMISDANLRIPELLVEFGKFDDAVARATEARDKAIADAANSREDKINAQYQLAYLLGQQASSAAEAGAANPDLSRRASAEYAKVYDIAKPVDTLSSEMKDFVAASLYNAGHLLYGLGQYEDYTKSVTYFELFTRLFPKNESYSAALEFLGFATFEAARLKADLDGFALAAEHFLRFSREFPKHKDAGSSQFQAGEAYFAVGGGYSGKAEQATTPAEKARNKTAAIDAYRKAISAYRGLVDRFRDNERAPEALYASAASYTYISDLVDSEREKETNRAGALAAYKELSEKYPQSEHAASAFLSVGNDYYNQASATGLTNEQKTNLYRKSIESYKRALQVPNIEQSTRANVEMYTRETEELLAKDTYEAGYLLVLFDMDMEKKKANAPKAIPYFQEIIKALPNTDYADLSYVQLGLCYEYLERWRDAENSYAGLIKRYTDANGNPLVPFSENVVQALRFARDRLGKIMAYRLSIEAQQQSGGGQ